MLDRAGLVGLIEGYFAAMDRKDLDGTMGFGVFANLGQSLGRIESLDQLLSKEILIAFVLLGFFALIPVVVRKFKLAKNLKGS